MKSQAWLTRTEEETVELGRQLGPTLSGIVLLIGNLGAGKTTLTRGIVEGRRAAAGVDVSSPTFTLVHQYGDSDPVFHIDLYRLDTAREVETLGLQDLFDSEHLVLLEWAERFPELLPAARTEIRIRANEDDSRSIEMSAAGA